MIKGYIYGAGMYFFLSQESLYHIPKFTDDINAIIVVDAIGVSDHVATVTDHFLCISVSDRVHDYITKFHDVLHITKGFGVTVGFVPADKTKPVEIINGVYLDHHAAVENEAGIPISAAILFSMTRRTATTSEARKLIEFRDENEKELKKESEETNHAE